MYKQHLDLTYLGVDDGVLPTVAFPLLSCTPIPIIRSAQPTNERSQKNGGN